MKYMCKSCKTDCDDITEHMMKVHKFSKSIMELSCKTDCDDITEHMMKVHKFSKSIMELQLKTNPNTYKNCFETKA